MFSRILRFAEYLVLIFSFVIASDAIAKNYKKNKNSFESRNRQVSSKLSAPQLSDSLKDKPLIYSKPSAFEGEKKRVSGEPVEMRARPAPVEIRNKAFPGNN